MKRLLITMMLGITTTAFAHEHASKDEHSDEHEKSSRAGSDKAVQAASEDDGIRLSPQALRRMRIRSQSLSAGPIHSVPNRAIVTSEGHAGVYRLRNQWFKFVEVKILKKAAESTSIQTDELEAGDQVTTEGAAFLRTAELEAWGGSGDGHGH